MKGDESTDGKKLVWLKLKADFFQSKRIKKLRKMAGGDTYTIIYLKMQLLSLKTDGVLQYTGLEEDFAAELALDLDESVEDVRVVLLYLISCDLIKTSDNVNFLLPYVVENTGSETDAAKRMRDMRERNKVTPLLRSCYTEKEKEKEIEIEIEKEGESVCADKPQRKHFTPPSVDDVRAYCIDNNYHVDAQRFVDYYASNGWMVGRNKMKDWKAAVRNWARKDKEKAEETNNVFLQILEEGRANEHR